ncbi:MAG: antibiotic biosynthesis monooxygenase [Candidatus Thiodiazotropha lotti]|nr:antibiotic biosynthesis monooxygenase [Candidatus Thiodiazotropha lotti]MCG8005536.1 antibiotic biosynthesis monooxygenase [Candidatus Thiodiazotropha lotti]MCW4189165.1 antibiotic biosynthesis monooxygenase [Candidatus Thiodiazotropha lotti]MCW4200564.1 antibiotic biosynthesis monooxygenase [Candidatus Thiodiazotropha lotti]
MYAVIFKAVIADLDSSYYETASQLRSRAMDLYGCISFEYYQEGDREISISYWRDKEQIVKWKSDQAHLKAQQMGREKWYRSYQVQVVKLVQQYEHNNQSD